MPVKIERKLKKQAKKKGLIGKRKNAYIYGTLNKIEKKTRTRNGKSNKKNNR